MNRTSLLSFLVVAGAAAVLLAGTAQSQSGVPKNQVILQPTTPGTSQSGHLNVSGTARAGQFMGGGAGVTGVNANLLDGIDSTAFLQDVPNPLSLTGSQPSGAVITGTNSVTGTAGAGVKGVSSAATGTTFGLWGTNGSTSGRGVFGEATSVTGLTYGGRFENDSTSGRGVYGLATATSGSAYGVFGQSQSSTGRGVNGSATETTGVNYGGYFDSNSINGYGVFAISAGPYGVYGQSDSTTGHGVYGKATATSGQTFGGRFYSDSTLGIGSYGAATSAAGLTYGGRFENFSTGGRGVFGLAAASTGQTYGVLGNSNSNDVSAYGVYALGQLGASGTKTFRIDHPFDPENKYLIHYSHEGPEPQNVYNGNVVTDAKGYATITLPDYFEEINKDPRYTLTVVDGSGEDFVQVRVVRKIHNNQFMIRTSAPNIEVSWRVDAVRNDLWVQKRGAPVVVEKECLERGRYQHPEHYGQPKSMGMDYHPRLATQLQKAVPKNTR